MADYPLVSIIVAVKNAKQLLPETLASLAQQNYPNLEIIVIDGGSTDGTVEVIQAHSKLVAQWVSEPDKGISDAFNKGLGLANGLYINFQGAGDVLHSPNALKKLFENLQDEPMLLCGKVQRVDESGQKILWTAPKNIKKFKKCSLLFKMPLPHQALLTHRKFFEQYGLFDVQTKFAMDYELLLRAYHQFPSTLLRDVIISKWRAGGVGKNRIHEIFLEYFRIKQKHQVAPQWLLYLIHYFNLAKYYFKTRVLRMAY